MRDTYTIRPNASRGAVMRVNTKLLRFPPTSGGPIVLSQGDKIRAPSGVAVEASGAILVLDLTGAVIRVDPTTGAQTTVTTGDNLRGARGLAVRR